MTCLSESRSFSAPAVVKGVATLCGNAGKLEEGPGQSELLLQKTEDFFFAINIVTHILGQGAHASGEFQAPPA